jgi:branched-chain amino acid transport system permease protein
MQTVLTILIDGLTYASWLFIVAVGLTLVFGVLKILNIAHGSFYALGAYTAASFVGWTASMQWAPAFSLVAMLLAAVAVAALVAPLTERGLLRFFYGRDEVLLVLVTYAMFLIMEDLTKLVWGANPYYVSAPYSLFGNVSLGVQTWVGYDFALLALALVVGVSVWWGLNRTRQGKITLAVIHSPEVAASMGVNV